MKKSLIVLIVLAVIIIVLVIALFFPINKEKENQTTNGTQNNQIATQKVIGIQVDVPKLNDQISSPLKITGTVNGGGWGGFEGQVGTVQLLDVKGKKIADGVLKATTDWTKNPVNFESTITFQSQFKGAATLLFSNENPSGLSANDRKFGLSIVVK